MSEEQTKFDTAQIRIIVEEALNSALRDRPTRSEVQGMIATGVHASLEGLRAELRAERVEQNRKMEQMLTAQVDRLAGLVNNLASAVDQHRQQVDQTVQEIRARADRQSGRIDTLDTRVDSITLLANRSYLAVFGQEGGDGPDSLYQMIRSLRSDVLAIPTQWEPRLSALEKKEVWRSSIERTILQAAQFAVSRRGIALWVVLGSALLGLAGRETIGHWLQGLLTGAP